MNTNIQTNPYQQNVDIIKGFFQRPIVLVLAIASAASCVVSLFVNVASTAYTDYFLQQFIANVPLEYRKYLADISSSGSVSINLPVFAVLETVAFFLFYFFSKSSAKDLNVPSTMLKVVSIIELVLYCVCFGLVLVALIFLMVIASFLTTSYDSYASVTTPVIVGFLVGFLIAFCLIAALIIFYAASKVKFADSVKKSTKTIYLYKNGAQVFGILTIIVGGGNALSSLCMLAVPFSGYLVFSGLVGAASTVILGVVAIQYSGYIKEMTEKFATRPPYEPVQSGSPSDAQPFEGVQGVSQPYDAQPYSQPLNPMYQQPYAPPEDVSPSAQETYPQADFDGAPPENSFAEDAPAGQQAPAPKFCSACGNQLGEDDYFCNNCGTRIK